MLAVSVMHDAAAQARYDGSESDRFSIRVGAYSIQTANSTVRIDSSRGPLGAIINFEDTLDVDSRRDVARLDGYYRINPRHRLDFSYFSIERNGTTTLLEELEFGDEVFEAGGRVDSVHNSEIFKLSYTYSFIHVQRYEFGVGAGLHITNLELGIDAPDLDTTETADGTVPLPVLSLRGRYDLTPKLSAIVKFEWFFLEFDDYKGSFTDNVFALEHQTFEKVGFGIGLNRLNMELEATDDDLRGEVESTIDGVILYANIGW